MPLTILDGGLGTELARRGVQTRSALWSAAALLDARGLEALAAAHRDYLAAGADVITANTFRTNRRALAQAGIETRFPELAERAVRVAREQAGHSDVRVAGSLAPLEDCYRPERRPTAEVARREHREHARALASAGCDLLLVETIAAADEGLIAVEEAAATGVPVWASAMARPDATLLDGSDLRAFLRRAEQVGASALLLNCVPCDAIDAALGAFAAAGIPFGAYAHMGEIDAAAGWPPGPTLAPRQYRARVEAWVARGATIVGGCCGTGPEHVRALAEMRRNMAVAHAGVLS